MRRGILIGDAEIPPYVPEPEPARVEEPPRPMRTGVVYMNPNTSYWYGGSWTLASADLGSLDGESW